MLFIRFPLGLICASADFYALSSVCVSALFMRYPMTSWAYGPGPG